MYRRLSVILISILAVCPILSKAQGFDELVMQLSQPYSGGTARMLGIGGSKVALGADAGNIYVNPAGLGFYNRSEWVFSPSLNYISTSTDYLNSSTPDSKLNFNFANLGVVFNKSKGLHNEDKWRGGSFSFSFNRINSFHNDAVYQGNNTFQDIIDYAVEQDNFFSANSITDLIFNTGLTFEDEIVYEGQEFIVINGIEYNVEETFGPVQEGDVLSFVNRNIYIPGPDGQFAFPTEDTPVLQREEYSSTGAQYAASLAYGGNYADKLYLGAGLNIMSVDKQITRIYTERPTNADLTVLTFTDKYRLNGTGVNATLGLIARPVSSILLGISYTTPTYYGMEETRDLQMEAQFIDETLYDEIINPLFAYNLMIPSKLRGGITYFFGKNGFITADVETSKTANAKFSNGDSYDFSEDNRFNQNAFSRTVNTGVGAEYRMDMFRFRAGINYITDPSESEDVDFDRMMYGVGAGIRKKNFFVDLSYNNFSTSQAISPYPTAPLANVNYNNSMTTLSIGFTF